jgi:hypothetical protein
MWWLRGEEAGQEKEQEMTVPCAPVTTLASVLVRYDAGVEGCHK